MKGNVPAMNPVMLNTKPTTCAAVTKERSETLPAERRSVGGSIGRSVVFLFVFNQRRRGETRSRWRVLRADGEKPSSPRLKLLRTLDGHNQQDTQRESARAPRFAEPTHTVDARLWTRVFFTSI